VGKALQGFVSGLSKNQLWVEQHELNTDSRRESMTGYILERVVVDQVVQLLKPIDPIDPGSG
jgi:hypothetical protein